MDIKLLSGILVLRLLYEMLTPNKGLTLNHSKMSTPLFIFQYQSANGLLVKERLTLSLS